MSEFKHDRELQARLLNHPAIVYRGVDPLWRWIAVTLMVLVIILVAAMAVRAETLQPLNPSTIQPSPKKTLITERFLDALEEVESGRDAGAVGDQGRSLGSYQFKAVAWAQVDTLRISRGLETRSYLFYAKNRVTARMYAREYLGWLEAYLTRALHRSPTHPELYAVWNLGPSGFRARGFLLEKCPAHVRKAGKRVEGVEGLKRAEGAK